jgi:hypothetical protein
MPLGLAPGRRPHNPQPPERSLDLVRSLALQCDSFESYPASVTTPGLPGRVGGACDSPPLALVVFSDLTETSYLERRV